MNNKILVTLLALFLSACSGSEKSDDLHQLGDPVEDGNEVLEAGATKEGLESEEYTKSHLLSFINENKDLSILSNLVEAAELKEALSADSVMLTLFAPNNEAFEQLGKGTVDSLLASENKERLAFILRGHLVQENISLNQIKLKGGKIKMLNEKSLSITGSQNISLGGAQLVTSDIKTPNGTIHIIDKVIL